MNMILVLLFLLINLYNNNNINICNGDEILKPKQSSTLHTDFRTVAEMLADEMGDYPTMDKRSPLKLTIPQSKALLTSNLYFWDPNSRIIGNMNEIGFDSQTQASEFRALKEVKGMKNTSKLIEQRIKEQHMQQKYKHNGKAQLPGLVRATRKTVSLLETSSSKFNPLTYKSSAGYSFRPGPIEIAPPIRFPGDGDHPIRCHTPDELRRYLDYVGIDHDKEVGVQLLMTPYRIGNKHKSKHEKYTWKTMNENDKDTGYGRATKIDGLQYFWLHGETTLDRRGRRCYDPKLDYEDDVLQVGPDSHEVQWGCTPFRIFGKRLQESVKCTIRLIGKKNWDKIEDDLLHELSFEAMRQPPEYFYKTAIHRVAKWLNMTDYEMFPPSKTPLSPYSHKVDPTDIDKMKKLQKQEEDRAKKEKLVADCFKMEQRALTCVPVMNGASGMREHGLSDFNSKWVKAVQGVIRTCHIPKGCIRLAAEQLLNFNLYEYSRIIPDLAALHKPIWSDQCRPPEGPWYRYINKGNQRLYASCMLKSLRHMCSTTIECCPTAVQHLACARNVTGEDCGKVCQFFDQDQAFEIIS